MTTASVCPAEPIPDAQMLGRLAKTVQPDRGVLWKVSRDGKDSFLYGVIHVAKLEWDFPGPTILNALKRSEYLAVEVDTTEPTFVQKLREKSDNIAAREENDLTSPEGLALSMRVSNLFRSTCLDEAPFSGAGLASKITSLELLSARDQLLSPTFSIDTALIGFSKATHKTIVELETTDEQAEALSGDMASMKRDVSKLESGETRGLLIRLATAWANGDLQELGNYYDWCGCKDDTASNTRLIARRNRTLAEKLSRTFDSQHGTFAAIGILHMIGRDGVVERLRQMGYSIERITAQS